MLDAHALEPDTDASELLEHHRGAPGKLAVVNEIGPRLH